MQKSNRWLPIAFFLVFIISLSPSTGSWAASLPPIHLNNADELIAEVNSLRVSNGLPPYNVNSILMQIAQAHTIYQASTGSATHYSADGSRPFQRALAAGYPVAGDLSRGGFFSENIIFSPGLTPAGAVSAWQGDAPHLNTMLSPNLQDVGAGAVTSGGQTFYTLDAGLASGSPVSYTPQAGAAGNTVVSEFMLPVMVSTPNESGAVYHEVQYGQSLWSIAIAYETTIEQLKNLNNLTTNDIYEGQKFLIKQVSTATTEPETPAATVTLGIPISTATIKPVSSPSPTPQPVSPATIQGGGVVVFAIIATALLAAGLGTWLSTRKPV